MRIVLNKIILANHGAESVSGFANALSRQAQVSMKPRAETVDIYDRGNAICEISFSVTRLHASVDEAEVFAMEHPQDVPSSGEMEIVSSNRKSKRFLKVVTAAANCTYRGCSSFTNYKFTGTEYTNKKS